MAPIKTPQDAFKELQEGKAIFGDYTGGKINKITIRYYTSEKEYVQPVYYFVISNPDKTYQILVPAVKSEYIMSDDQMKEMLKNGS